MGRRELKRASGPEGRKVNAAGECCWLPNGVVWFVVAMGGRCGSLV
jgi:hypothetical protein